jgi:hypothetical protein
MDEGELSTPLTSQSAVDSEYPVDSCCLLQDVAERSRQKSGMLQGYSDAVLRAEALEEQLVKARKHSAMLQSKLYSEMPSSYCSTAGESHMTLAGRIVSEP